MIKIFNYHKLAVIFVLKKMNVKTQPTFVVKKNLISSLDLLNTKNIIMNAKNRYYNNTSSDKFYKNNVE